MTRESQQIRKWRMDLWNTSVLERRASVWSASAMPACISDYMPEEYRRYTSTVNEADREPLTELASQVYGRANKAHAAATGSDVYFSDASLADLTRRTLFIAVADGMRMDDLIPVVNAAVEQFLEWRESVDHDS